MAQQPSGADHEPDSAAQLEAVAVHGHSPTPAELESVPHEKPEDWGWHAELGGLARGSGWISAAILMIMIVGNQVGHIAIIWLVILAVGLGVILVWDRNRRKNSWRG
ncbi:MAG: DUF2631 domain-containing protein [Mycobacteriales bacterium]